MPEAPSKPAAVVRNFSPRRPAADKGKRSIGEPLKTPALRLTDEPEEPERPQLKKRKVAKPTGPEAPTVVKKPSFAQLLATRRKAGSRLVVRRVDAFEALLKGKLVAVKPLAVAPTINPVGAAPTTAIPVELVSPICLGPNIKPLLEEINLESESDSSVGNKETRVELVNDTNF